MLATWNATHGLVDLMLDGVRKDIAALRTDIGDLSDALTGVGGNYGTLAGMLTALQTDVAALKSDVATAKTNITTLQGNVTTLQGNVTTLQGNVTALQTRATNLETRATTLESDVSALKTQAPPITFAFAGTPVQGSMINMPVVANMAIPANLAGSRYYNQISPLVASTFTLSRITAAGSTTTIGTVSVSTAGVATFSGTGSNVLVAGDTLRMTATTIGGSLTNVGITIPMSKR